ncbi:ribosomal protein S8 [Myroides gitamensis]|uniref:ATP-binding protein n=1 Tax=Myroides odoratus TaxID=256 RepID=UPI002169FF2D|nr:ATP-binding protein [Myroides odoratus]MCS4238685.1 ribosomal protein S8 [Myroides odoratus]MDH6600381.1 ribosomal protein S8 [Myroides gitamensis]
MIQKQKAYNLEEVFTPSKPADLAFVERNEINRRIDRAIRTSGKQIIIYGFSGVGKTTLLSKKLKEFEINSIKTSCISGMTIQDIVIDAFNQLAVYYPFDRIIFPFEKLFKKLHTDDIYPKRKSELEIHLDYYFNNEEKIIYEKHFRKWIKELNVPIYTFPETKVEGFLRNNENHKSWESENHSKWKFIFEEQWSSLENQSLIIIKLPTKMNSYHDFSETSLYEFDKIDNIIKRNQKLSFKVDLNGNKESLIELSKRIEKNCTRIWDGTRNLPLTNFEIYKIIIDYIFFEYYEYNFKKVYSINNEELITIELTNKYHNVTRCYVRKDKIKNAFRDDIKHILNEKYSKNINSFILLNVSIPQIIFGFEKLLSLFKEEMIAYQVVYNSEKINPVIFYSPVELNRLGYK